MEVSQMERIAQKNMDDHFRDNPCRGIVLGINEYAELMQISWIMGRSPNSQNRVYAVERGVVKTVPADDSKVEDPRLIIYNAMRSAFSHAHVVSNGDQTDTVVNRWRKPDIKDLFVGTGEYEFAQAFYKVLRTRNCEPDPSTFTPRITGFQISYFPETVHLSLLTADIGAKTQWIAAETRLGLKPGDFPNREAYNKAIGKRIGLNHHAFPTEYKTYELEIEHIGFGYCLTTYMPGSKELPSFTGEPLLVPIRGSLEEVMQSFWERLEPEWRVALAGRTFSAEKGKMLVAEPINRFQDVYNETHKN